MGKGQRLLKNNSYLLSAFISFKNEPVDYFKLSRSASDRQKSKKVVNIYRSIAFMVTVHIDISRD